MVRKGRRKEFGKFTKKIAAVGLALAMTVSTAIPTYAYYGFSGEFTRSERLTQTRVTSIFSENELGVVNFESLIHALIYALQCPVHHQNHIGKRHP